MALVDSAVSKVMDFAMRNAVPIIKNLDLPKLAKRRTPPDVTEILKALLKVPGVDKRVASVARHVIKNAPALKKKSGFASKEDQLFKESVTTSIGKCRTVPAMLKRLEAMQGQKKYAGRPKYRRAIAFGVRLLKDGQDTVYSPSHPFYRMFRSKNRRRFR